MMLDVELVNQVVGQVFSATLNREAVPADLPADFLTVPELLTGRIAITGGWEGTLSLLCGSSLARQAAAAMFDRPASEIDDADMRDALAELTNILGGNLRPLLPQVNFLGLPTVSPPPAIDRRTTAVFGFRCEGRAFAVCLHSNI